VTARKKASIRRREARGERHLVIDRKAARKFAFEQGLSLCWEVSTREGLLDGTTTTWKGMEILNKPERFKVLQDVRTFARASEAERRKAIAMQGKPKPGFVEKVKQAFQGVLGA
jgi:hypothetical protein